MQYNHKVTIQYVEEFDDYGQPVEPTSKTMRCCILSESITNEKAKAKRKNRYDMLILVSARTYAPYSQLFSDSVTRITRESRVYEVKRTTQINGFSGKPKYFEIALNQVHK